MEYGDEASLPIVVQLPPPDGRRWKATEAMPEPPVSLAEAVSVIVWRRFAPGSSWVDVGASVSALSSFDEVVIAQLPSLSATRYRYCALFPEASASALVA